MRLCDALAKWLVDREIKHAFGIIGGGNYVLWDAISNLGYTSIIPTHHEQAATMAATYYARSSGRIGLALVTTGAGSANAITGVLAAHMDAIPLLVISGNEASKYMTDHARVLGVQGYDSVAVARHFTKKSWRVMAPRSAIESLDCAFEEATQGPQGPVWVDFPKDIQGASL